MYEDRTKDAGLFFVVGVEHDATLLYLAQLELLMVYRADDQFPRRPAASPQPPVAMSARPSQIDLGTVPEVLQTLRLYGSDSP